MDENKGKEVKAEEVKEEVKAEVKSETKEAKPEKKFEKASTTTTETKPNFFKTHGIAILVCVLVIALAVGAFFIFKNVSGGNPKDVFNAYVEAMKEGNSDKIMNVTDVKGALAWNNCGRDKDKFIDAYNSISNEEADSYKDTTKSSLDSAMSIIKAFGGVEINLKNIEEPESLGNNLYKVKGNVTMKVLGMEQDQSISLVTYNGKYIGEMSE